VFAIPAARENPNIARTSFHKFCIVKKLFPPPIFALIRGRPALRTFSDAPVCSVFELSWMLVYFQKPRMRAGARNIARVRWSKFTQSGDFGACAIGNKIAEPVGLTACRPCLLGSSVAYSGSFRSFTLSRRWNLSPGKAVFGCCFSAGFAGFYTVAVHNALLIRHLQRLQMLFTALLHCAQSILISLIPLSKTIRCFTQKE